MKGSDKLTQEQRADLQCIYCDACGRDVTPSSSGWANYEDYLLLGARGLGYQTTEHPLDRDYHFCDLGCLDTWRDAEAVRIAEANLPDGLRAPIQPGSPGPQVHSAGERGPTHEAS